LKGLKKNQESNIFWKEKPYFGYGRVEKILEILVLKWQTNNTSEIIVKNQHEWMHLISVKSSQTLNWEPSENIYIFVHYDGCRKFSH